LTTDPFHTIGPSGNGNQCADNQICLGHRSIDDAPATAIFGTKYGCAPASLGPEPVLCPGAGEFSCPQGDVCVQGDTTFAMACAPSANATATSDASVNMDSTIRPEFAARATDICSLVAGSLPFGCSCENAGKYGAVMDCVYDIYVTQIGLKGTLTPCIAPATMGLEIYETAAGFSYPFGISVGQTLASFPIPGMSIGMPSPFPAAGMYASFAMNGTIAELKIGGTLDACADAPWPIGKTCGSKLGVPGLPVKVFEISASFSDVCDDYKKASLRGRA